MDPEPIFLYGAGGHGRSVSEVLRRQGRYRVAAVLDDALEADPAADPPILGGRQRLPSLAGEGLERGFISIGNNADRELVSTLALTAGLSLVTLIDPAAVVANDAVIGQGTVMMPQSVAAANSRVGDGVILNTSCTVDHDCQVEDYAHLSAGVHMTGGCRICRRSFVGIGAVLGGPVTIGERAIIGAGAAVMADVPAGVVAAGVPARQLSVSP